MSRGTWHDRLFRALLRLFPGEFRGDFGDQMTEDFRDQRAEASRHGAAAPVARLWTRTALDAVRQAPREHLDILRRDAGYALRLFRRHPGTSVSVLLTLAIGIGLTSAVFSVAYGVLWQPLPLPGSERIVVVNEVSPAPERQQAGVSPDNLLDWQSETTTLDALASIAIRSITLIDESGADATVGGAVTRQFFDVTTTRPALGRLFGDAEFAALSAQVAARAPNAPTMRPLPTAAIITHGLWKRRFGARPDIVGQRIETEPDGPVEVVGVLGPEFQFPLFTNIEILYPDLPETGSRRFRYLTAVGRLAGATSVESAQAEFDVISERLAAAHPDANAGYGIRVRPLRASMTDRAEAELWFLLGIAMCVLLIACANVSNLLLTHTGGRSRELATRAALGASRAHLVRQALTEGLVLATAGAGAGFLLAWWAVPALIALAPRTIPRLNEVAVGWPVFGFTFATALAAGLASGLAAALTAGRQPLGLSLVSRRAAGRVPRPGVRHGLIVGQVAVALMLAVAAGLLVQTLRNMLTVPLGFDPSQTISVGFSPNHRTVRTLSDKAALEQKLLGAIRSLDGVTAAGIGSRPLTPGGMGGTFGHAPGGPEDISVAVEPVSAGYLEALGARVAAGRFFTDADGPGASLVALVNATAAAQHFPAGAVGRRLVHNLREFTIVGVLADVRRTGLEEEVKPTLYLPSGQTPNFSVNNLLVRASGDPRELLPAIRTVVRQIDPRLPLTRIQTLPETLDAALAPRRFTLWLVGLFALVALGLAAIGIYGALAESVAQRVPEIGVRMALGATAGGIIRLFVRQGGWMIAAGITVGTAGALALGGVMTSLVFQVPTTDPWSIAGACLVVTIAGLAACAIPARRAARVDPVVALRQE